MTAQVSEILVNSMTEVDFSDYALCNISMSEPADYKNWQKYPFQQKSNPEKRTHCVICRNGYVSVYELNPSGQLQLIKFEYPYGPETVEPDLANEILEGDYWVEFRKDCYVDKLFVPFESGKIVADKRKWRFFDKNGRIIKDKKKWCFFKIR